MPVPMALARRANIEPLIAPGSMGEKALLKKLFLI